MSNIIEYQSLEDKLINLNDGLVLLDKDVAELYGVEPRKLREQVKRNIDKFPKEYAHQVSDNELKYMVSQNATPSKKSLGGHNPWVFTERGLYMVATVLKSDKATEATIAIIETFAKIKELNRNINTMIKSTDEKEHNALATRTGEILDDIIDVVIDDDTSDMEVVETETKIELNLGFFKKSKSTKRKKE